MTNFILFSDYFKPIANKIKFVAIVIGRFFKITLRRRKSIQLIELDYCTENLFDKSYLVITYCFKNALWYNFKNLKKTTKRNSIVFNLANISSSSITFIVHGVFQKKIYKLIISQDYSLESKSFRTNVFNINKPINFNPLIKIFSQKPAIHIPNISIYKITNISNKRTEITINHTSYNQTDFL